MLSTSAPSARAARVRCVAMPPAPVPYREPFFAELSRREGVELTVAYQSRGGPGWDVEPTWWPAQHRYEALHLRSWQHTRAGRSPLLIPRGIERTLRRLNPDCVVSWEYSATTLRSLAWCRRWRRSLLVFTECTPGIDALLPAAQLHLHRWLARRVDGMIAASSAARERLLSMGVAASLIEVSLQPADVVPFRQAAQRRGPPAGAATRFAAVARLVPDKNLGGLLEAFARAGLEPGQAELHVYGMGPLGPTLERRARELGVAATFHGYVPPSELPRIYAESDALVLVSTYEPFGVVAREACAAGLPIICSATAGAAGDVAVQGRNALLVDPLRVEQIAAALRQLALDGNLRSRLSAASRELDAELGEGSVDAFLRAVLSAGQGRARGAGRAAACGSR